MTRNFTCCRFYLYYGMSVCKVHWFSSLYICGESQFVFDVDMCDTKWIATDTHVKIMLLKMTELFSQSSKFFLRIVVLFLSIDVKAIYVPYLSDLLRQRPSPQESPDVQAQESSRSRSHREQSFVPILQASTARPWARRALPRSRRTTSWKCFYICSKAKSHAQRIKMERQRAEYNFRGYRWRSS